MLLNYLIFFTNTKHKIAKYNKGNLIEFQKFLISLGKNSSYAVFAREPALKEESVLQAFHLQRDISQ